MLVHIFKLMSNFVQILLCAINIDAVKITDISYNFININLLAPLRHMQVLSVIS